MVDLGSLAHSFRTLLLRGVVPDLVAFKSKSLLDGDGLASTSAGDIRKEKAMLAHTNKYHRGGQ